jgi:DNA polymerase III subunit delta'
MTGASGLSSSGRPPVLERIVGQPVAARLLEGALRSPVHAYLFLGPSGTGRRDAAIAFAAALICPEGGCGKCVACRETLAERHPDLDVIERAGASILVDQAHEVARLAMRTPRAARYHVIVLVDFDLVEKAAPALLKTIEEPPDTTILIVIAEAIAAPFATIASRCLHVGFRPLPQDALVSVLVREGADPSTAASVARAAAGRLDRARLLVREPGFAERLRRWSSVPGRLDGTGATVAELTDELLEAISEPLGVLRERQASELARLAEQASQQGDRTIAGRAAIEERHRREQRRVRTDELRAGFATLASVYRERLQAADLPEKRLHGTVAALEAIDEAANRLVRNVNETMLLEWLLLRLDS